MFLLLLLYLFDLLNVVVVHIELYFLQGEGLADSLGNSLWYLLVMAVRKKRYSLLVLLVRS